MSFQLFPTVEEQVERIAESQVEATQLSIDTSASPVPDAVVGKPLKDLKVDKLAGASWTSEAFNKALEVARQEASIQ